MWRWEENIVYRRSYGQSATEQYNLLNSGTKYIWNNVICRHSYFGCHFDCCPTYTPVQRSYIYESLHSSRTAIVGTANFPMITDDSESEPQTGAIHMWLFAIGISPLGLWMCRVSFLLFSFFFFRQMIWMLLLHTLTYRSIQSLLVPTILFPMFVIYEYTYVAYM